MPSPPPRPAARSSSAAPRGGPRRILHRAGNFRELVAFLAHPAVDAIEADLWARSGRLLAHHPMAVPVLPLLIDRSGIYREPADWVQLADLLAETSGAGALVIDLKSRLADPAPDLAHALLPLPDRSHLIATCESWAVAERLRAWLPDLSVAYSVRSERQLRRYVAGRLAGTIARIPITVRHTLLHRPEEVRLLRAHAGFVGAWTVDDVRRARALAAWGVDAITSNDLAVLEALPAHDLRGERPDWLPRVAP